jgi:hypothetical protein
VEQPDEDPRNPLRTNHPSIEHDSFRLELFPQPSAFYAGIAAIRTFESPGNLRKFQSQLSSREGINMNRITLHQTGTPRDRFIETLDDYATNIAAHVLAAWDGETVTEINTNLDQACQLLDEVTNSAVTMGFALLGATGQHCTVQIHAHLQGPYADLAICPGDIIWWVDLFVDACSAVVWNGSQGLADQFEHLQPLDQPIKLQA